MIYNLGVQHGKHRYNSYLITGEKNVLINTVPIACKEDFFENLGKYIAPEQLDAVVLLSSAPEQSGCLELLLLKKSDLNVYGTSACLKMYAEVLNGGFNGVMCKNRMSVQFGGAELVFYITPNLTWPDSMIVFCKNTGSLFSGELFSAYAHREEFFQKRLKHFIPYVKAGMQITDELHPECIYPSVGECIDNGFETLIDEYNKYISDYISDNNVLIVYESQYGSNKIIANTIEQKLSCAGIKAEVCSLDDPLLCAQKLNKSSGLIAGCYTENRTMPQNVWKFLSFIDVNLVSGKPYFVFGSCGWSNEGAFILNEILPMLKMRRSSKMFDCVRCPNIEDFEELDKCLESFVCQFKQIEEKKNDA